MYTFERDKETNLSTVFENGVQVIQLTCGEEQIKAYVRWLNCCAPVHPGEDTLSNWFFKFVQNNPQL